MDRVHVLLVGALEVADRLAANPFLAANEWVFERTDGLDAALHRVARGGIHAIIVETASLASDPAAFITALRSCTPTTPVLIIADPEDREGGLIVRALRAGARTCLFDDELHELAAARAMREATAAQTCHSALRASIAKLEALLRAAPLGVFEADASLRIVAANPAFAHLIGSPERNALVAAEMCRIDPDDAARIQAILDAQGRLEAEPVRLRKADGTCIDVWLSGELVSDESGREAVMCIVQERTANASLDTPASQALKMEALGRLASGIVHEINTPIQFVSDSIQFVREAFADFNPLFTKYQVLRDAVFDGTATPDAANALRTADEHADLDFILENTPRAIERSLEGLAHVTEIVQSIRDFAHPDTLEKAPADLNQAIRTTLRIARNELRYVADVETDFGDVPLTTCHAGEIQQVVLNLLVNAAHAIAEVVGDSGDRGRITVRTWTEDGSAIIAVSDTGCGIPESMRDRIFDPFFTTKAHGRGTGQGLTLARNVIVDRHNGDIVFESEPGARTTFYVRLPLEPDTTHSLRAMEAAMEVVR